MFFTHFTIIRDKPMRYRLLIPLVLTAFLSCATSLERRYLELDAAELYHHSFMAGNVRLGDGNEILIDARKLASGEEVAGVVETDVIDLLDPDGDRLAPDLRPVRLEIACRVSVPAGGRLTLEYRGGDSFFNREGWSEWRAAEGLSATPDAPGHRYWQARITLSADKLDNSPRLSGVVFSAEYKPATVYEFSPEIVRFDNPEIVRSSVEFGYERMDNPVIRKFRELNSLDSLVAGCRSEMDTLVTLLNRVGSTRNTRHGEFDGEYPWDIERIVSYGPDGAPSIEGHCMSYAVVYIAAVNSFGFHARHWADQGFRFADHEVVEVWSNSHGKWIYFDPSLAHYYRCSRTGEPMSILELHDVFVHTFFRDGETLRMDMDLQRERVKEIGGKNVPIEYVSGDWSYGKPNPDYDWGWLHGYLAAGFMRLTTRNDFHSRREPWFPHFGEGVHDFDEFLSWSDEKTPPGDRITRFSDRRRDFYWTLDQASVKAVRTDGNSLDLEFGHSMPFFEEFRVRIDDGPPETTGNRFHWMLHGGLNSIEAVPCDKFGRTGIPARLEVMLRDGR